MATIHHPESYEILATHNLAPLGTVTAVSVALSARSVDLSFSFFSHSIFFSLLSPLFFFFTYLFSQGKKKRYVWVISGDTTGEVRMWKIAVRQIMTGNCFKMLDQSKVFPFFFLSLSLSLK